MNNPIDIHLALNSDMESPDIDDLINIIKKLNIDTHVIENPCKLNTITKDDLEFVKKNINLIYKFKNAGFSITKANKTYNNRMQYNV